MVLVVISILFAMEERGRAEGPGMGQLLAVNFAPPSPLSTFPSGHFHMATTTYTFIT